MLPFLQQSTDGGGWVLDPFAGFGTTLVAGWLSQRPTMGIELDARRCDAARERLARLGADERSYRMLRGSLAEPATLAEAASGSRRFDLCLTNVPYFGAPPLTDREEPGQLYGHRYYEPYLQEMRQVFGAVYQLLAPGAWCIAMVQNLRLSGRFVPLAWDLARLLGERFELHEERLLIYAKAGCEPVGAVGAPTTRAHEYALACRKPHEAAVSIDAGRALLEQLRRDGFDLVVHGSFAHALEGDDTACPQDIDVLCRGGDHELSRLAQWLEREGFRIESWNARVGAPICRAALAYRHYVRARRIDFEGRSLQIDVGLVDVG